MFKGTHIVSLWFVNKQQRQVVTRQLDRTEQDELYYYFFSFYGANES